MTLFKSARALLPWWAWVLAGSAAMIHLGTAILRLNTFFPSPQLVDFAAFYAGAWGLRLGVSPFVFSPALLAEAGLSFTPPTPFNPPFWYIPLLPLTWVSYPFAAWIWVWVNLTVLVWSSHRLALLAGYHTKTAKFLILGIVISFGPVFLDLTLGQVSTLLLGAALLTGTCLSASAISTKAIAGIASMTAAMIKVYPLIWVGIFPFLQSWGALWIALAFLFLSLLLFMAVGPAAVMGEWVEYLLQRITSANTNPGVDDQSLLAWLDRMAGSHTYAIPGLSATTLESVSWHMPWEIEPTVLRMIGYGLIALILLAILWIIRRQPQRFLEAKFYLWILGGLIAFPHIERYNHALLLPALAWLWAQDQRGRTIVILAYFLEALARLTHLWVRTLPAPWAPLLTGSGLFAVLLTAMAVALRLHRSEPQRHSHDTTLYP